MIAKSVAKTQKFGEQFAQKIIGGGVVCLFGELGSGKTTLVQGIARGLGIKQKIISPTFIIVRRYEIKRKIQDPRYKTQERKKEKGKRGERYLWHIDLYRLNDIEEIKALGIEELWQEPKNILLIEWPEKIADILPQKRWEVKLEMLPGNERKIQIE